MGNEANIGADEPQAGDTAKPQPQAGVIPTSEPQAGDGNEPISLDEAKKLRSEAFNLRKRLKDAETLTTELKTFKDQAEAAQLSDTEKRERATQQREKQLADLQVAHDDAVLQLQEERVSNAIRFHAIQQGIDPKLAQRLLDRSLLEHDENGHPTNLDAAFKTMMKEFTLTGSKPAPTSGGATNPSRSQSTALTPLSWDLISKMSSEEYRARRTEIQQWMGNNPFPTR